MRRILNSLIIIFITFVLVSTGSAASCTYTLSPASYGFSSSSGMASITVTTSLSSCSWTATSNDSWITVTRGNSGTGNGTVSYYLDINTTGIGRKGTMTIGGQTFTVRQANNIFIDDPQNALAPYIYAISAAGITHGCNGSSAYYCLSDPVTRGAMAVFIIRALYGDSFEYTQNPYFTDVPPTYGAFSYIQKFRDANITQVVGTYDVNGIVTRGQMAVFIIRALYGDNFDYTQNPYFTDVPPEYGAFSYIQKMKDVGITQHTGTYNVDDQVTRDQMAVFLARAFLGMDRTTSHGMISSIEISGNGILVFSRTQKVEHDHLPDATLHAFINSAGTISLTVPHLENYRMTGNSLLNLTSDPNKTFSSYLKASDVNEANYNYHHWITAPYTPDGTVFYALAHHEWYACLAAGDCSTGSDLTSNYTNSWVNSITHFTSRDGGASWSQTGSGTEHVVVHPEAWGTKSYAMLNHYGMYMPSPIIKERDYYYSVIGYQHRDFSGPGPQGVVDRIGMTLIRTSDISSTRGWHVWNKEASYTSISTTSEPFTVIRGDLNTLAGSLVYDTLAQKYILIYYDWNKPLLIWYMTLDDLDNPVFSEPKTIVGSDIYVRAAGFPPGFDASYFKILDPLSPGQNFEFTGENPFLFYTVTDPSDVYLRDIYRVQLKINH
jgi:hypothetical protein